MGIDGYFYQPFVQGTAFRSFDLITCLNYIKSNVKEPPKIVLVDGDNFRHIWVACLKTSARYVSDNTYRRGDFIKECRDRASYQFVQKIQGILSELQNQFEAIYVIWGNPELEPIVKAEKHIERQEGKAANRKTFNEQLGDYLTSNLPSRRKNLPQFIDSHCGLPTLPSSIIHEARVGFFGRLPRQGIVHVVSRDESDLSIARAEFEVPNAVVYSNDADFIATVNCHIIRALSNRDYQVILGRRSSRELAMAALIGNEYTSGQGCPEIDWKNVHRKLDLAIASLASAGESEPSAVAICRQVVDTEEGLAECRVQRASMGEPKSWSRCSTSNSSSHL